MNTKQQPQSFSSNGTTIAPAPASASKLHPTTEIEAIKDESAQETLLVAPSPTPTTKPIAPQQVELTPMQTVVATTTAYDYKRASELLEANLVQFGNYQAGTAQAHEQYLNNQATYTKGFYQLMQEQQRLLLNPALTPAPGVVESLERNMLRFHDYQSETLRVHDHYLQQQAAFSSQVFQLINQQPQAQFTETLDNSRTVSLQEHSLKISQELNTERTLRQVGVEVGENYHPATTLTMQPSPNTLTKVTTVAVPPKPVVAVNPVATLKQEQVSAPKPATPNATPQVQKTEPALATLQVTASESEPKAFHQPLVAVSTEALTKTLLQVVSEKTGYPVEMLELEMNMEADLGIDSIKRVEILGAMQEHYPTLPRLNPDELATLHTLGQIIVNMQTSLQTELADSSASKTALIEANTTIINPTPTSHVSIPIVSSGQSQNEVLTKALLEVVSEKTGYPVEMLEVEMDMEADLGIDSIKRVEILGAMQERHPDLNRPNPDELAELRTLKQIIEYLSGSSNPAPSPNNTSTPAVEPAVTPLLLNRGVVRLQHLPEPDYQEFPPLSNQVCLLTDDGSAATSQVAQALLAEGWRVLVLSFPTTLVPSFTSTDLPASVERLILADLSEASLEQLFKTAAKELGPIASFIHLNPVTRMNPSDLPFTEVEKLIIKQVFLAAKHLKFALTEAAAKGRACFITVARLDGALGLGTTTAFSAIGGGLFGLTKTLNQEWQQVYCRALDLSPELGPEKVAQYILAELHDPNRLLVEVGYNADGERTTLVSDEAALLVEVGNAQ
jgi:acyl carrier protein/NAD(P)-dependent dehydrogenase (short-subunit alcohol dehydrogenase family)